MDWRQAPTSNKDNAEVRPLQLVAFRFQLGLRNYRTPTDHTNGCRLMREIAARYPDFNVTTFHEYYPFADQYLELKPALLRNCLLAIGCMAVISLVGEKAGKS